MSPQAQRIAIAEARGYKVLSAFKADCQAFGNDTYLLYGRIHGLPAYTSFGWDKPHEAFLSDARHALPDYLSDLNAMHEAEKGLQHYGYFADQLAIIMKQPRQGVMLIGATAPQRAEAFLRTLNLWDDAK